MKIGIPNMYIEEIGRKSSYSASISPMEENGQYLKIQLKKPYYKGDILEIDFSFLQHQMYREKKEYYQYSFTPGWFNDIAIGEMCVTWSGGVGISTSDMEYDGVDFTKIEYDLTPGKRIQIGRAHV